jgi:hypothetical protein
MKKLLLFPLIFICIITMQAQSDIQSAGITATLKSSSRLFKNKDDLTTVIRVIPSGSVVDVLDSDSTYYYVAFEEDEGYIYKRHAVPDKTTVEKSQPVQQMQSAQDQQPLQQDMSRFSYLESKYGTNMAARLITGKIWKGMNSDMVKDSWGRAEKINRVINGNIIQEEWIYKNSWLYFENNTLIEWGPRR